MVTRAAIYCLLVVGLLLPTLAMCGGEKLVASTATLDSGGKAPKCERDGLHPIVVWAIVKFIEGVGWIIIGYELQHMWEYVWEKDLPELWQGPPEPPPHLDSMGEYWR